jgi:hypothetical protein
MFNILNKKDIIHIIAEIAVVVGVVYYFSLQNKKLLEHIQKLDSKLEEQQKVIDSHEVIIKEILSNKESFTRKVDNQPRIILSSFKSSPVFVEKEDKLPRIEEIEEEPEEETEEETVIIPDSEVNLDKELEEELKDLE